MHPIAATLPARNLGGRHARFAPARRHCCALAPPRLSRSRPIRRRRRSSAWTTSGRSRASGRPRSPPTAGASRIPSPAYDADENRLNADIWVLDLAGGAPRRLTTNKASDTSPVFSPDGRRLAFLSKRDGDAATELYVLPARRRRGRARHRHADVRREPEVVPGREEDRLPRERGRRRRVARGDEEGAREAGEEQGQGARHREPPLPVLGPLAHGRGVHAPLRRRPRDEEGRRPHARRAAGSSASTRAAPSTSRRTAQSLVFSANSTPEPYRTLNWDLFLVPAAGGEARNLTASRTVDDTNPVFSPDGRTIAFGTHGKADGWPDYTRLALLDVASGKVTVLTEGWENAAGGWTLREGRQGARLHGRGARADERLRDRRSPAERRARSGRAARPPVPP